MNKFYTLLLSIAFTLHVSAQGSYLVRSAADPELMPFYHGVASGDPLQDRVIIWTRVSPETSLESIDVQWRVSRDTTFATIVASGIFTTDESRDYTVKVDVTGLEPNTWYYYEFSALERNSLIGRTKTTPAGGVGQLRFATVSCSNYPAGYFNAYQKIVDRNDVDAILHLGDYLYEYGGSNILPNTDIVQLGDYRLRHSVYKLDTMLRNLHQQYPWITTWDDHESANNSWRGGAENHNTSTQGPWIARKSASVQAYEEWLPIRLPEESNPGKIFRKISYGGLADIFVLDTRLYDRDLQGGAVNNPAKKLLGPEQLAWLTSELQNSTAKWKIIAQQVMVAQLTPFGLTINDDQWEGYTADRKRLFDHILANNIQNVIFLTGDIHTAWANDLPLNVNQYQPNTGNGSVAVEFVCTSITSGSSPIPIPSWAYDIIYTVLPHIKYSELYKKGYSLLDLGNNKATNNFYYVDNISQPTANQEFDQAWCVNVGERRLVRCTEISMTAPPQYQAPSRPRTYTPTPVRDNITNFHVLGTYPNPFIGQVAIEFNVFTAGEAVIRVFDMKGSNVYTTSLGQLGKGLHIQHLYLHDLPNGAYQLSLEVGGQTYGRKVVKM
jgi:alkaline phosphatase D